MSDVIELMTTNTLKAILIIFFFNLCSLQNNSAKAQTGIDTTFEILKRIDYASYVRKPVDSLLHHIPGNYQSATIISSHKGFYGNQLFIEYANDVVLIIRVANFRYMNPQLDVVNNPNATWDLTLFKKEDISFSALLRGSICYVGCDKYYSH